MQKPNFSSGKSKRINIEFIFELFNSVLRDADIKLKLSGSFYAERILRNPSNPAELKAELYEISQV